MFRITLALAGLALVSGQGCPSVPLGGSNGYDPYGGSWDPEGYPNWDTGYTQSGDACAILGYYGDGVCDVGCNLTDPDCVVDAGYDTGGGYDAGDGDYGDGSGGGWDDGGSYYDWCDAAGYYGDGVCDADCPLADPDCAYAGYDVCEVNGWYGDGYCDWDCLYPDPDCWE